MTGRFADAVIVAAGGSTRMGGGDKARIEIGGVSILDRVLATLSAQCTGIIINANGDPKRFADTGLTVVADSVPAAEYAEVIAKSAVLRRALELAREGGGHPTWWWVAGRLSRW